MIVIIIINWVAITITVVDNSARRGRKTEVEFRFLRLSPRIIVYLEDIF